MSLPKGVASSSSNNKLVMFPQLIFQSHQTDFNKLSSGVNNYGQESVLKKLFFHNKNIQIIQKQIIVEIFRQSNGNYLIDKQSPDDILAVMRNIFKKHATHSPNDITNQIRELNYQVVKSVIPCIMLEIRSHEKYLEDIFNPRFVMDHPVNSSKKGSKILPPFIK